VEIEVVPEASRHERAPKTVGKAGVTAKEALQSACGVLFFVILLLLTDQT
jgi:hypothetical protein